ncbi:hypothetical protein [Arthrobacter sp. zg-Y1143]|uniref:endonuclease domain-containing protein n=1 Tax=Arthrobacter sp. zg-Y1143 TaxID=3049065 RepID=UPI0024C3402A|nr:hypothetical protein [Arthrobacter sp. zg-Y1143]MDK1328400.1 hypothetical protein [Arthrobacter sp. zg-Y1143]
MGKPERAGRIGLPGPVFSVAEARARGVPASELRRRAYDGAGHGLRTVGGAASALPDAVRPLAPASGTTVASHTTAAALWGIWLPYRFGPEPLHLTRPLRFSQPRRKGVVGHHAPLLQLDVVRAGGLLVTSPAWTWRDLAALLSPDELVAAGDSLLRRRDAPDRGGYLSQPDPLCGMQELQEVLQRRAGNRGASTARTALELMRPGADSAQETRLRLLIRRSGLPEPAVNQWIIGPAGQRVSRPDLQYVRLRIALEYEGEHHLLDPDQWHRDIARDDGLRRLGWVVLRFSKKHLRPGNQAAAAEKVRAALLTRGWRPGQPA